MTESGEFQEHPGSEPVEIGVDEAGRGPMFGPMVYGAFCCPSSSVDQLSATGVRDSKQLTVKQREEIYEELIKIPKCSWAAHAVSPMEISGSMLAHTKITLNQLAYDATARVVNKLVDDKGIKVERLVADIVGPEQTHRGFLEETFPDIQQVHVQSKADVDFPIVSAASIIAKVTRDRLLSRWVYREKGAARDRAMARVIFNGYPNDPVGLEWIDINVHTIFGLPEIVRFSWSNVVYLLDKRCIKVDWPKQVVLKPKAVEATKPPPRAKQKSIKAFFGRKKKKEDGTEKSAAPVVDENKAWYAADKACLQVVRTLNQLFGKALAETAGNPTKPGFVQNFAVRPYKEREFGVSPKSASRKRTRAEVDNDSIEVLVPAVETNA